LSAVLGHADLFTTRRGGAKRSPPDGEKASAKTLSISRFKPKTRLFQEFTPSKPVNLTLSEADLDAQLRGDKSSSLFLGQFEKERIEGAFERFGIYEQLRRLGYERITLEFHAHGPFEHFLRLFNDGTGERVLLGEVLLKTGRLVPASQPCPECPLPPLDVLAIEWILMQHVRGQFTYHRRRLPGQNYPGLGLGNRVMDLLLWVTQLLEKDALLNMPEYFHNAVFYDRWFKFFEPEAQGVLDAVQRDLSAAGYDLADMSYAAYFHCLVDKRTGQRFHWQPKEQVLPLADKAKAYFAQPHYARRVQSAADGHEFTIDTPVFEEKMLNVDRIEW
jgi:hypothetical protein